MISEMTLISDIANFPLLGGDERTLSYGVYISQLIRFARVCSHANEFNVENKYLSPKPPKQGHWYHTLRMALAKLYRRHNELVYKFNAF